jgi:histidine triad (HIT) family protein
MNNCLFCKIIDNQIPSEKLYEDEDIIAFKDIDPQAPHHFLVIPKQHIATINDAKDATLLGKLITKAAELSKKMGFDKNGYRLIMNCNSDGGQVVYHIHLHCLAGRKLNWPPG